MILVCLGCLGMHFDSIFDPQIGPKSTPGGLLGRLGASWGHLEPSWGVLGVSWGILGASWSVLGASWGVLGTSWGRLGASWGRLGRVLGPPGASRGPPGAVLGRPGGVLGAILGSFLASFSDLVFGAVSEAVPDPFLNHFWSQVGIKKPPKTWEGCSKSRFPALRVRPRFGTVF